MIDRCSECRVRVMRAHDTPVLPDFKKESQVLFLSDFPLEEDLEYALTLSGLHRRAQFIHRFIKETKLDQDRVSHATVLRCITKSKSLVKQQDFLYCGENLIHELKQQSSITAVFCFGSIAGKLMTGKDVDAIEKSRGQIMETVIPGIFCVITYALGLMADSRGCGSCGTNVQPFLAQKDAGLLKKELYRRTREKQHRR